MSLTANNKLDTNKYELTIHIDAESFEEALEKAYKKNIKKINVPGFRRGKAPRKMVEKLYGEGVFFEDAINDIYPAALSEAIAEAKLEIVARPEVEMKEADKENGVTFTAVCIVKPEVAVKDYKGIEVEKTVKEVTDEDVESRLKAMQDRNARQIDVEDRASQNGDTLVFDFEGSVDGVPFDGGKAEKYSLELGSGQFIPGFEPQLENRNIGDEFDVNVTFPEDYHAEELKGKEAVFKCKVHEIKAKEVPALDDEFAKDVSEFDTLDELRADIRKKMEEQNEKEASTEVENKLIDKVIENMEAEIPNEMYESAIDDMIRDFDYRLQSQGMNLDTYMKYTGMELASFRQTFEEQAKKRVQIRLALEKIVELESVEVSDEDIEAEYKKLADMYQMEADQVKQFVSAEELSKDIAVNKAVDLVKESAVIR